MKSLLFALLAMLLLTSCATIHSTAEKGDITSVQEFLKNGENVNKKGSDETTPLMMAVKSNNPELVAYLIEKGADVNAKDKDGYTPIMYTKYSMLYLYVLREQKEVGDYSGSYFPTDKNWKNQCFDKDCRDKEYSFRYFPGSLYWTQKDILDEWENFRKYKEDLYKIINILLEKGTDTNILAKDNDSILNYAVFFNMFQITEKLLKNGADADIFYTNLQTKTINIPENWTVCAYSTLMKPYIKKGSENYCKVQSACYEEINFCVQHTDINNIYNKTTMLAAAAEKGDDEMIEKLVKEHKADVNIQNKDKETAIFEAVRNAQIKSVKKLIELGADLNIVNKDGYTPIIIALLKDKPNGKIIKTLINSGADINFEVDNDESDYDGMSVIEIAKEKKITIKAK